jgi:hypothetical protein
LLLAVDADLLLACLLLLAQLQACPSPPGLAPGSACPSPPEMATGSSPPSLVLSFRWTPWCLLDVFE